MHPVLKTILERIALGVATLFVVSLVIFSAIELLPGDFSQVILGQAATQANMAAISKELGLDQPPHLRYIQWIAGAIQGDLGTSFSGRNASGVDRSREVVDLIAPRLSNTLFLASMTAIIAVPISLILGVTSALYRNSIYDRSVNTATLTTISFPEFFVAYILILTLSSLWPIFPSLANVDADTVLSERIYKSALPALTLTLVIVAHMMRMTRAAIINLLASPYIQMARLSGASQSEVIIKHALPNALAPVFVSIAFGIASAILIESSLSFLGIGVPADEVTWGGLLNLGRLYHEAWWLIIYPGIAIFITITVYNMIAEAARDALDPKLKS